MPPLPVTSTQVERLAGKFSPTRKDSDTSANSRLSDSGADGLANLDPDQQGLLTTVALSDFAKICPYHVVFDKSATVLQCGSAIVKAFGRPVGQPLVHLMELTRPQMPLTFESILNFINAVFVLRIRSPSEFNTSSGIVPASVLTGTGSSSSSSRKSLSVGPVHKSRTPTPQLKEPGLQLKGQMMLLEGDQRLLFIGSPYITSIPELLAAGLHINSIPIRDATRDLILLNQQRLSEVEAHRQLEEQTEQVEEMKQEIEAEKEKAKSLLREVLPSSVADQLMEGKTVEACEFADVTVLFSDVPAFSSIVPKSQPADVVALLDDLFTRFDRLVEIWHLYKVETVGDSYMVVGGAPDPLPEHAELVCYAALGMIWEARSVTDPVLGLPLQVRVGIHSGPIVAGVVGDKMPRFCLFGDTVNTASRMESHGMPGRIHMSQKAYEAANRTGRFEAAPRGLTTIKGKGRMDTFWLTGSKKRSLWEITQRPRGEDATIDGFTELQECLPPPPPPETEESLSQRRPLSLRPSQSSLLSRTLQSKTCRIL